MLEFFPIDNKVVSAPVSAGFLVIADEDTGESLVAVLVKTVTVFRGAGPVLQLSSKGYLLL